MPSWMIGAFYSLHQMGSYGFSHMIDRLANNGDRRRGHSSPVGIMKGDQRKILRDRQAEMPGNLKDFQGNKTIRCDDGTWPVHRLQQIQRQRLTFFSAIRPETNGIKRRLGLRQCKQQ